jgi:hypothetical protein
VYDAAQVATIEADIEADIAVDPSITQLEQITAGYRARKALQRVERRRHPDRFTKSGEYTAKWRNEYARARGDAPAWSGKGRVPWVAGPIGLVKAGRSLPQ